VEQTKAGLQVLSFSVWNESSRVRFELKYISLSKFKSKSAILLPFQDVFQAKSGPTPFQSSIRRNPSS
jgi:hypothetical protein